jgi:hypothetical protein
MLCDDNVYLNGQYHSTGMILTDCKIEHFAFMSFKNESS